MDFSIVINNLAKIKNEPLLATDAHLKMAPLERINYLKNVSYLEKNPKDAAVLALLYPKNKETHFALIVRNTYPGVHSSQISFPGGKYEKEDTSLAETALRETYEEIGVLPEKIEIIKSLSTIYIPPSNFLVAPFLGIASTELQFEPNPEEVKHILEVPLAILLNPATKITTKMTTSYAKDIVVPAFQIEKYVVWGATAMILSELKELLKSTL